MQGSGLGSLAARRPGSDASCHHATEKEAVKAAGVRKVLGSVGFEKIEGRSVEEGSFDDGEGALAT